MRRRGAGVTLKLHLSTQCSSSAVTRVNAWTLCLAHLDAALLVKCAVHFLLRALAYQLMLHGRETETRSAPHTQRRSLSCCNGLRKGFPVRRVHISRNPCTAQRWPRKRSLRARVGTSRRRWPSCQHRVHAWPTGPLGRNYYNQQRLPLQLLGEQEERPNPFTRTCPRATRAIGSKLQKLCVVLGTYLRISLGRLASLQWFLPRIWHSAHYGANRDCCRCHQSNIF